MSTPQDVVAAAIEFKGRLDFRGVASLCNTESMESVQRDFLRTMALLTEHECREEYPDFSDEEIGEVMEKLRTRHRRYLSRLDELLPGTTNFEEAASLEASAFFERLLRGAANPELSLFEGFSREEAGRLRGSLNHPQMYAMKFFSPNSLTAAPCGFLTVSSFTETPTSH